MPDSQARNTIINSLDKNIFVIAGAGSGKTSMLVNRMISLIEQGKTTIDKICAITFTINAAAEFLKRLRETLARRANGEQKPEDYYPGGLGDIEHPELDKKALESIDLCFAGTIDAFCNLALSEYPLDADIPSSSSVLMDETEIKTLYKKEYARLSQKYKSDPRFKVFVSLFTNPAKVFADAIEEVIEASYLEVKYNKPSQTLSQFVADFKNKYEKDVQDDFKELINAEPYLITINNQGNVAAGVELFEKFKSRYKKFLSPWNEESVFDLLSLSSALNKNLKFSAQPCNYRCLSFKYSAGNKNNAPSYSYDEDCSFSLALQEIEKATSLYTMDFLVDSAKEIRKELKKQGKLTFSEYLYIFKELVKNDALNNNMVLIKHIREKFSYFLIDESQDTNPFQYELFLYLAAKKPAPSKQDIELLPGSLFIVGDPKQSIYRFRNADIDSYNEIKDIFNDPKHPENIVLELTNNYRSTSKLCNYFNRMFSPLMSSIYTNITNANSKKPDGEGLYTFTDLVGVIKTLVHNPQYSIRKKVIIKNEEGEDEEIEKILPLEYEDIMIITKKKKDLLSDIAKKLDAAGIPYYTEGDNILDNYQIVEAIYAAYCYIAYPTEKHIFDNLMTSPLFNLKKEEAVVTNNLAPNLAPDQQAILDDINNYSSIKNPVILLKTIIEGIVFKYVSSQRMDFAYYLLNKLEEAFASSQVTTLDDGAKFLFSLIDEPQERIAQMQYKPDAVYVANVHKVKGLEKPVVIMCKSGTNYNEKGGIGKHMDYKNNESYIFRLAKKDFGFNQFEINDPYTFSGKLDLEATKLKEEFLRLEYVAVTRARNYLFIEKSENDSKKYNCWFDLIDSSFTPFIVTNTNSAGAPEANKPITPVNVSDSFENLKNATYKVVLPSKLVVNHNGTSNTQTIPNQATNDAAEKGTLIHALMEIYVLSGMQYKPNDAVEETLARYGQSSNDAYRQLLTKAITTMINGGFVQDDGKKEDLFAILKDADEIYCEHPFAYMDKSVKPPKLFNGTIDLLYVKDGKHHIVDYKTNYDDTDLYTTYQAQLNAYAQALKEIDGIDADTRLYHIDVKE